eukprot:3891386-Prymnesium_polylepis.1
MEMLGGPPLVALRSTPALCHFFLLRTNVLCSERAGDELLAPIHGWSCWNELFATCVGEGARRVCVLRADGTRHGDGTHVGDAQQTRRGHARS